MARPRKEGMDYFPHDTDASSDEKLEALRSVHGNDGYAFYFILLERIYRTSQAALDVSKPVLFKALANKLMVAEDKLNDMLQDSFDLELLDREAFQSKGWITSNGIRKRHEEVENMRNKWRKGKESGVIHEENPVENSGENTEKSPQSKVKESKANKKEEKIPYEGIIDYLNQKSGKSYKSSTKKTQMLIKARLNEGFTLRDIRDVIDIKCSQWKNDPQMNTYLRPETLFGTKFEGYLNEKPQAVSSFSGPRGMTSDQRAHLQLMQGRKQA